MVTNNLTVKNNKQTKKNYLFKATGRGSRGIKTLIPLLILLLALSLVGCGSGEKTTSENPDKTGTVNESLNSNNEGPGFKTYEKSLMLKNSDDSYTSITIALPSLDGSQPLPKEKGKTPLVLIAHGFSGTKNSGGAEDLAEALVGQGIASARMDFNHYISENKNSDQTNTYTLSTMEKDLLLSLNYALENYAIDKDRIGLYGRSMGGRVLMSMANKNPEAYRAMALVAPAGTKDALVDYIGGQKIWDKMKKEADQKGFSEKLDLKLTPAWFSEIEAYDPSTDGGNFKSPVLVVYNLQDDIVTSTTAIACAITYPNVEAMEVSTEDGHGYEMGFKESPIKNEIIDNIVAHFKENL